MRESFKPEKISIFYDPIAILSAFIEEKKITIDSLKEKFSFNPVTAILVLSELKRQSLISSEDSEFILTRENKVVRAYTVKQEAFEKCKKLQSRNLVLTSMPAISRMGKEIANETLEVAKCLGIDPLDEENSKIIEDILERRGRAILNDSTSEELRGLAEDLKRLRGF